MSGPLLIPTRDYLCNHVINRIPWPGLRMSGYRRLGIRVGPGTSILMLTEMQCAVDITIGRDTVINRHCHLDGRGGLNIGDNVNISSHTLLVAGSHDVQDGETFRGSEKAITIEDYVWLCTRCTILGGVTVGCGAVVAAWAVVTKSVPPRAIMAGVPARQIGERTPNLNYCLGGYYVPWH